MKNNRFFILLALVALLLLVPLIAMQFTDEVNWDLFDFTIMGILLVGTVSICELILRNVKSTNNRVLICGMVLAILFLIWAELAVGVFGSPFAGS